MTTTPMLGRRRARGHRRSPTNRAPRPAAAAVPLLRPLPRLLRLLRPLPRLLPLLLPLLLAATAPLAAQGLAVPLLELCERSGAVVTARVLHVAVDGGERRVRFLTQQAVKGTAAATFELHEPATGGCGEALALVVANQGVLLFLDAGEPLRLAVPGPRAVCALSPELLAHVRALCTVEPTARVRVLAAALTASEPRVRDDAALALATLPDLARADAIDRARVLAALPVAIDTNGAVAPALIGAAARLRLERAVDALLPRYLQGGCGALAPLVLQALPQLGADRAATLTAAALSSPPPGVDAGDLQARALAVLETLPADEAREPLQALLRAGLALGDAARAVRAGAAMLRLRADLPDDVPADLRRAAAAQVALDPLRLAPEHGAPRFRSIDPRPRRRPGSDR